MSDEKKITTYDDWISVYSEALQIFLYCQSEFDTEGALYKEFYKQYGEPSEELKNMTKERLKQTLSDWMDSI
ncbi:MAG TPA: hypothetical protein DCM49_04190 [Lachnospiraceae bacterium]|nr:hypothetical protein [Lachnospiraceae bacterium]